MQIKAEHAKLAAFFHVDNGTGTIPGVSHEGMLLRAFAVDSD